MNEFPRKRLEVTIKITAHDWDNVDQQLSQVQTDFLLGEMRGGGFSTSGYSITVDEDEAAPDKEEFVRRVLAWDGARKAARGT